MQIAQTATCMDMSANASGQPAPGMCRIGIATSGANETRSTAAAIFRNMRIGRAEFSAICRKTKTAPATPIAVSKTGGNNVRGTNRAERCRIATATMRMSCTTPTDTNAVTAPARKNWLRSSSIAAPFLNLTAIFGYRLRLRGQERVPVKRGTIPRSPR